MTAPKMTYLNVLHCGRNVICPYCGKEWDMPSFEGFAFVGAEKCEGCGHSFEISIGFTPSVTTYQYEGRKRMHILLTDGKDSEKCDLCGKSLVTHEDTFDNDDDCEFSLECPICGKVVCNDCERNLKPCCNEYELWIGKSDEVNQKID